MIKINNSDSKTLDNPIVITDAENHVEAKIFYNKYLEYYMQYHDYDKYEAEEIGDTLDQLLVVHRFYKDGVVADQLWIDYTIFFHKWEK